jgi:hypothetical protein
MQQKTGTPKHGRIVQTLPYGMLFIEPDEEPSKRALSHQNQLRGWLTYDTCLNCRVTFQTDPDYPGAAYNVEAEQPNPPEPVPPPTVSPGQPLALDELAELEAEIMRGDGPDDWDGTRLEETVPPGEPTPEEISAACEIIRAEWTPEETLTRTNPAERPVEWSVPGTAKRLGRKARRDRSEEE